MKDFQSTRDRISPIPGNVSRDLALNTVEIVKFDLGLISCSIRVAIVQDPPTITMLSFIENLLVIFAAAANFLSRSK
jgi:hypothetical protein